MIRPNCALPARLRRVLSVHRDLLEDGRPAYIITIADPAGDRVLDAVLDAAQALELEDTIHAALTLVG